MDEFVGIVKLFAGTYAPEGWAFCDGRILNITQYQVLFAVIGSTYGGNGIQTFALPDLRGRVAVGAGNGPGQPPVVAGQAAGSASVTLTTGQLPAHTHSQQVATQAATTNTVDNTVVLGTPNGETTLSSEGVTIRNAVPVTGAALKSLAATAIGITGSNQPVNTMPPFLGMNYIICLTGIYPPRP